MSDPLPRPLLKALSDIFGDALLTDAVAIHGYGTDNSRRHATPQAVVLPQQASQVQALVRLCREHRVAVTARGRGTSTTGAPVPVAGGVVVSFEHMDAIVRIAPDDRLAVVEPGVLNGALQQALVPHGMFWPPDPTSAPYSTVGGNLACNAGGPGSVKYGSAREHVLALVAVTGTGDRIRCGAPTTKDSSGYDLVRLLVGSEGTLALIVEATLKVQARPQGRRALRALYRDVGAAAAAVARVMAQPVLPCALEFMDGEAVRLARERGGAELAEAGALLMIEVDGSGPALEAALQAVRSAADGPGVVALEEAVDEREREALWAARRALSPALRSLRAGKINEDVVVPVSRLPELVHRLGALAAEYRVPIVNFGHAGNGNLHVNILFDPDDAGERERAARCLPRVFDTVLSLQGTLSGEHGIGAAKRPFMAQAFDPPTLAAMRSIKQAFDPDGILNPGKVLPDAWTDADRG
ncbi:MAG TPA: FAD-linked oxidase C-terminal domain-containing protein [Xanthomonadaceae bacterium]|nr:FAD-linked oxidase C-terminal domain-containing protein [Xanthomonadaceae bacterium]